MKALLEFTRTTLIGGVLILLPIYLVVLLLLKAASQLMALIAPLTSKIPASVEFHRMLAAVIVVVACFAAGLLVRTGPGRRGIEALQRRVLQRIPGYTMVRSLVAGIAGEESGAFAPALVELEDALVPAMIVEELPDGRCVVLVPSVPTPIAGALYVLPAARVHRVNVPLRQLFSVYSKWGAGTGALVAALPDGSSQRG